MGRRFRVIVKVLCQSCQDKLDVNCNSCEWVKYNNVNKLTNFVNYLNEKRHNWIFFRVYKYSKGEPGNLLKVYKNGKEKVYPLFDNELDHIN